MGFSCSSCQYKRQLSCLLGGLLHFPSVMSPRSNTFLLLCLKYLSWPCPFPLLHLR